MANHMQGCDGVARHDLSRQGLQRGHLRLREGAIAEFVAGIDELDADRAAVDIRLAFP